MKNFFFLLNQQFSFSPQNEYKLATERRAAARREAGNSFTNSNWRRRQESNLQTPCGVHALQACALPFGALLQDIPFSLKNNIVLFK